MLVVYRPVRRWRLPCAEILYLGDRSRLVAVGRALAGHLLGQGLVVSLFPARWSLPIPGMHREIPRTQPLLVRSSLADGDMDLLYSEIATMGL